MLGRWKLNAAMTLTRKMLVLESLDQVPSMVLEGTACRVKGKGIVGPWRLPLFCFLVMR